VATREVVGKLAKINRKHSIKIAGKCWRFFYLYEMIFCKKDFGETMIFCKKDFGETMIFCKKDFGEIRNIYNFALNYK